MITMDVLSKKVYDMTGYKSLIWQDMTGFKSLLVVTEDIETEI